MPILPLAKNTPSAKIIMIPENNTIKVYQYRHQWLNYTSGANITHLTTSILTVSNYKKKKFLPPSNREEYERRQIIKSELARAENNNERIGSFFTKLDLPLPSEIIKVTLLSCYKCCLVVFSEL